MSRGVDLKMLGCCALWELDVVFVDQDRPFYLYPESTAVEASRMRWKAWFCAKEGHSVNTEIMSGDGSLRMKPLSFHSAPDV